MGLHLLVERQETGMPDGGVLVVGEDGSELADLRVNDLINSVLHA